MSDLVALVRHPQGAFKNVPQVVGESGSLTVFLNVRMRLHKRAPSTAATTRRRGNLAGRYKEHPAIARRFVN